MLAIPILVKLCSLFQFHFERVISFPAGGRCNLAEIYCENLQFISKIYHHAFREEQKYARENIQMYMLTNNLRYNK
jgi:hypothetical protein